MSSIAQKMGHSTAAATGMVDKLQEMGYLKRMSAAKDRRKSWSPSPRKGAIW